MMRLAFGMVLAAAMLPYITTALAKSGGGYDNKAPRDWAPGLQGWRRRADAAHRNHFEALPAFAAAVLAAVVSGASPGWINALAVAFVVLRVVYTAVYIADQATLRSVVWVMGLGCVIALFCLPPA